MSKDIQSYFTVVSEDERVKKEERERSLKTEIISLDSDDESAETEDSQRMTNIEPKSQRTEIISFDSEDEAAETEDSPRMTNIKPKSLKTETISLDSEDESAEMEDSQRMTNIEPKLKPGNVLANILNNTPKMQRKVRVLKTPNVKPVKIVEKQTLKNLEFKICIQNIDRMNKEFEEDMRNEGDTK